MKYNQNNMPLVCMQKNSTCYKQTENMKILGILWHSTGCNNPNIKRYVQPFETDSNYNQMIQILGKNKNANDWNHIVRYVGLNAWIGKLANGTVATVQTMPWNFRPWGCGQGSKGSCNDGWIQFEICEDGLNNKEYCEAVYKEACELTAFLCKIYNLNPLGTVNVKGVEVPVILCHKDSHDLGFGSNHGDIMHWFPKFGYSMETARQDVKKLIDESMPKIETNKELYRIRKTWKDSASQKGAYYSLESAINMCKVAGSEYKVFNSNGDQVYPEVIEELPKEEEKQSLSIKVGDPIKLIKNPVYANGKPIPSWVQNSALYVRKIKADDNLIGISIYKTGPLTGYIDISQIDFPEVKVNYLAKILKKLEIYSEPNSQSKVNGFVNKNFIYTIISEKNGFGKLKSQAGWVDLKFIQKV